jgi:hypothetical protein
MLVLARLSGMQTRPHMLQHVLGERGRAFDAAEFECRRFGDL